jgi:hypothetical protein
MKKGHLELPHWGSLLRQKLASFACIAVFISKTLGIASFQSASPRGGSLLSSTQALAFKKGLLQRMFT